MSYPKKLPCPNCGNADVVVYSYDNGARHVECNACYYLGPGEGSIGAAIKAHNERVRARSALSQKGPQQP